MAFPVRLLLLAWLGRGRAQVVAPGSEAECDLAQMFQGLQRISTNEACHGGCETGRGECPPNWTPTGVDVCTSECGRIFEPFWDVCGTYLISAGLGGMDDMGQFYDNCLDQLYPPGTCGTFCNEHTFTCFLDEVHQACCDEGGRNCVDGQDVPLTCPVCAPFRSRATSGARCDRAAHERSALPAGGVRHRLSRVRGYLYRAYHRQWSRDRGLLVFRARVP
jgi:hypothetical protein